MSMLGQCELIALTREEPLAKSNISLNVKQHANLLRSTSLTTLRPVSARTPASFCNQKANQHRWDKNYNSRISSQAKHNSINGLIVSNVDARSNLTKNKPLLKVVHAVNRPRSVSSTFSLFDSDDNDSNDDDEEFLNAHASAVLCLSEEWGSTPTFNDKPRNSLFRSAGNAFYSSMVDFNLQKKKPESELQRSWDILAGGPKGFKSVKSSCHTNSPSLGSPMPRQTQRDSLHVQKAPLQGKSVDNFLNTRTSLTPNPRPSDASWLPVSLRRSLSSFLPIGNNTMDNSEIPSAPHGTPTNSFYSRDNAASASGDSFHLEEDFLTTTLEAVGLNTLQPLTAVNVHITLNNKDIINDSTKSVRNNPNLASANGKIEIEELLAIRNPALLQNLSLAELKQLKSSLEKAHQSLCRNLTGVLMIRGDLQDAVNKKKLKAVSLKRMPSGEIVLNRSQTIR